MVETATGIREGFWKNAILAGIIAGVVFMMAEMLMVWLFLGQSRWGPPRMIAAMAMGPQVLPPPATFDFARLMVAMMIHFSLSVVYGIGIGCVVRNMSYGMAVLTGAVIGLVIYLVNFYLIASFIWEWFAMARNWVSLFAHLLSGLTAAASYVALSRP